MRADGTVKVLDFGLAKAMDPAAGSSPSVSQAPTISTPAMMTGVGMILGTAAYMSPEQARGTTTDKRADLWAFGVVLWEMLKGKRLFEGATASDTLAAVLRAEPDWAALPTNTPPLIRRLLRRCLEKDRRRRLDSASVGRLEIDEALTAAPVLEGAAAPALVERRAGRLAWMAFAVAAVFAAAMAVPTVRYLRETPPPAPPETRVEIVTPATDRPTDFALSPDGRQIVFVATGDGASRLWLRSLAVTTAQPLVGTEGARYPFWSPDGRSLGFFAGAALKRLDLGGGAPQTLAPVVAGQGGTWNADGVIVFAPGAVFSLMRVSATGGAAVAVTTLGPQQGGHRAPSFLPDGRRFLFSVSGAPGTTGIYLGALDKSAPIRLTPSDSSGTYLPTGWLLWMRAGTLVAQRLDVTQAALMGEPVTVADGVAVDGFEHSAVSVAATGLVAYRTGPGSRLQLTWVDRAGAALGTLGDPDSNELRNPRVSPDGRRVAVARKVSGNTDIWLLDGTRISRLTFDVAVEQLPVWSPDGTRIAFSSTRTGVRDLYSKLTSGGGVEERLVASDQNKIPSSWSADGRFLLYL